MIKNKKSGFTLVEILVVIGIICVLAGILFAVGSSTIQKAQIQNTQGTIFSLASACEQYRAIFYLYPDIDLPGSDYPGTNKNAISASSPTTETYNPANFREFNRRLRFMLEEKIAIIGEQKHGPFLSHVIAKTEEPLDGNTAGTDQAKMFADVWGNPLYVCPGRDHRGTANKADKTKPPKGPQNYVPNVARFSFPLDIYSAGPNGTFQVGMNQADTDFDISSENPLDTSDDLVSWLLSTKHAEAKK